MTMDLREHEEYIVDALSTLERGTMLEQMSDAFAELAQRVRSLQKAGAITLKVDFRPEGNDQISVTGTLSTKLPQKSPSPTTFFITPEGRVTVDDPLQADMHDVADFAPPQRDVRDVKVKPRAIVDTATGEITE